MTCLLLVFYPCLKSLMRVSDIPVEGSSRSSSEVAALKWRSGDRSGGSSYHYYHSGYGSSSDSSTSSPYLGFMFILVGGIILAVIVKSLPRISLEILVQPTLAMIIKRSIIEHNTLAISHWNTGDRTLTGSILVRKSTLNCRLPGLKWNSVRALEVPVSTPNTVLTWGPYPS